MWFTQKSIFTQIQLIFILTRTETKTRGNPEMVSCFIPQLKEIILFSAFNSMATNLPLNTHELVTCESKVQAVFFLGSATVFVAPVSCSVLRRVT